MASASVSVCFELGHEASLRTKRTAEGFTHDWEVFVRGSDGADISYLVERVVFTLHETFLNSRRVIREPPYSVRESGYAGFILPIEVIFKNAEEPRRMSYNYDLTLQTSGPPISMVVKQTVNFPNPSEDLRRKLIRSGGSGNPTAPTVASAGIPRDVEPERPKPKGEKLPRDSFSDLFGQPIRRAEQPKTKHKAKHIPRKEVRDKPKKQSPSSSKRSTSPKRPSSPKKAPSPVPTKRQPSPKRPPSPKRATSPKRPASPGGKKTGPSAKVPRQDKEAKDKVKKDKKEKRVKDERSKDRKSEKEAHKKHKKRDKKRRSPSEEKKRELSPAPVALATPPPSLPPPPPEKPVAKQPLKMLLAELSDPDSSDSESVQSEEEPAQVLPTALVSPPVPPPRAPELARDEPRFTPAYVSELRALQQRIMSLESNAELQQVVRMISQTGRFEITKKTFDFDLCALDRTTVQRLMDLLHPPLSTAS